MVRDDEENLSPSSSSSEENAHGRKRERKKRVRTKACSHYGKVEFDESARVGSHTSYTSLVYARRLES